MSRALSKPLLLEPDYSRTLVNALARQSDIEVTFVDDGGSAMSIDDAPERQSKSYHTVDGIAVLPVSGTLLHKYGHVQPYSGCTGYDGIAHRIREADSDAGVHTIMLDMDSPGGEVAGCAELAKIIAATETNIVAYVDELSASAAYWLASSCDLIVGPPSAQVGSIGVVRMHADMSGKLEDEGIKVTFIHAGRHKVDGNPYAALPEDVRASFQAEIDFLYDMFVEDVARGRSVMTEEQVRATEAKVYRAEQALGLGMIDAVMSKQEFLGFLVSVQEPEASSTLSAESAATFTLQKAGANFEKNSSSLSSGENMKPEPDETVAITQADLDAARAEAASEAREQAIAEYKETARLAAERTSAINSLEGGNDKMKTLLASDKFSLVNVEDIATLLAATPKSFDQNMDIYGGANVTAEPQRFASDAQGDEAQRLEDAAAALQNIKTPVI